MKKIFMTLAAIVMVVSANAQDKWYGSKEGGFAITFNANPLLNYAGNMFNGTQNNSLADFEGLSNGLFNGTTVTGKYFLKDNLAINAGFGFNNVYDKTNNYDGNDKKVGFERDSRTRFMVKGGLEYRMFPGKRLQPLFGADIVFGHDNDFEYQETDGRGDTYAGAPKNKLGLMLSAGVEYFVIPQISVGANVNFGASKEWNRQSTEDHSRLKGTKTTIKTGDLGGNISLNFYF